MKNLIKLKPLMISWLNQKIKTVLAAEVKQAWNVQELVYSSTHLPVELPTPKRKEGSQVIDIASQSAVFWRPKNNSYLFTKNPQEIRPIASLTKLMTALVFLDNNPGWEEIYTIKREDRREGGKIFLFLGDKIKVKHLFHASLIASANTATMALANSTGLTEAEFVDKMNQKAKDFGLENTSFADPVGLSEKNLSSAQDVAKLLSLALNQETIKQAVALENYEFSTEQGKIKQLETTDQLLSVDLANFEIKGGKTGYTDEAGGCLALQLNRAGEDFFAVVLGAENHDSRFVEMLKLLNWLEENYNWPSNN